MSLYKYSKIDDYTLENLNKNQLYVNSVNNFNDPYEFIFKYEVRDSLWIDFLKLIFEDSYTEIPSDVNKDDIMRGITNHYFAQLHDGIGAVCFTENENDDLLWAHYGDCHRGICVEFDNNLLPFSKCEKIEYVNEIYTIIIDDIAYYRDRIPIIHGKSLIRKNTIWSYEKEWRLILEAKMLLDYQPTAIRSITFGFFCKSEDKLRIIKATSHLNVQYYDVARSKDRYRIVKQPYNFK